MELFGLTINTHPFHHHVLQSLRMPLPGPAFIHSTVLRCTTSLGFRRSSIFPLFTRRRFTSSFFGSLDSMELSRAACSFSMSFKLYPHLVSQEVFDCLPTGRSCPLPIISLHLAFRLTSSSLWNTRHSGSSVCSMTDKCRAMVYLVSLAGFTIIRVFIFRFIFYRISARFFRIFLVQVFFRDSTFAEYTRNTLLSENMEGERVAQQSGEKLTVMQT